MIFGKSANKITKRYSEYDDSPKWTLLDNFNIQEEEKGDGSRPFVRKCLPKRLRVTLTSVQVINSFDWKKDLDETTASRGYDSRSRIEFDGTFDERITVFTMESGAVETFSEFKSGSICPTTRDEIGGKRNATLTDGIFSAGGRGPKVPDGGLMEGEPGRINHFPEEHSLLIALLVDEVVFDKLVNIVSRAASIQLTLLCELFEGEVSAALSGPGQSEYGLLLSEGKHYARARLDGITVFGNKPALVEYRYQPSDPDEAHISLEQSVASLDHRLQHILWALIAIAALLVMIILR
ncbi:hypothetical protein [Mesorhizobium sp. M1E.F.Ca.ET.063.01.1.1]|uniref:hypothetical protein n=1 Tax=Mesorhizobium sp. M1E.F.Ca.ET.063.01.1.1 TaxID=2496750 RepID=UPI000FC9FEF2|nr:hypothetical protein [Mesorhizobium sp. M1E.F.Ca.ET.063.01.1.1]RUW84121.1 hypothetical protein EOA29_10580 [Mesorhizobium sp. M1E.F.Ca.ET.063.01.1.1]